MSAPHAQSTGLQSWNMALNHASNRPLQSQQPSTLPPDPQLQPQPRPQTGPGSRMSRACLECRLAKFKCSRDQESDPCQRCLHHGFECVTVSHRRGRKPKSRLAGIDIASVGPISHSKTSVKRPRTDEGHRDSSSNASSSGQAADPSSLSHPSTTSGYDGGEDDGHEGAGIALELLRRNAASGVDRGEYQNQAIRSAPPSRTAPPPPPPHTGSSWDLDSLRNFLVNGLRRTQSQAVSLYTLSMPARNSSIFIHNRPGHAIKGNEDQHMYSGSSSSSLSSHIHVKDRPKTLASILDPYDAHFVSTNKDNTNQTAEDDTREDPVTLGILSQTDARQLFSYFITHLNIWSGILDVALQQNDYVQERSSFLYSVILFAAAKAIPWKASEADSWEFLKTSSTHRIVSVREAWKMMRDRLHAHAKDQAARSLIDGNRSVEAVQAFFFLATWKDIDDSLTHVQSGFAFRLALDMRLGDSCPANLLARPTGRAALMPHERARNQAIQHHFRKRQRTFLQLFVQDRLQSIYYVSNHTIPVSHPLIRTAELWKDDPLHGVNDSWCCAAVEVRKIQSRWQGILEDEAFTRGYRPPEAILTSIRTDLDEWYAKWSTWTLPPKGTSGSLDSDAAVETAARRASMQIWMNGLSLHLGCSILRQHTFQDGTLTPRPKTSYENGVPHSQFSSRSSSPAASSHLLSAETPSVRFCIEAARGVLQGVLQAPAAAIRAIPDSLSLEVSHAARFLTSMVCVCEISTLENDYLRNVMDLCQQTKDHFQKGCYAERDSMALHARFLDRLITAAQKPAKPSKGPQNPVEISNVEAVLQNAALAPSMVSSAAADTRERLNDSLVDGALEEVQQNPFVAFDSTMMLSTGLGDTALNDYGMGSVEFDTQAFLNSIGEGFF